MRPEPLFKVHAPDRQAFVQNGERERQDRAFARLCPAMRAEARQRITRQIGRALEVFGRDVLNNALHDLDEFEARLKMTPLAAYGYRPSMAQTVQNAVRYLYVAARDGDHEDLQAVLHRKSRRRHAQGAEPLPVTPADEVGAHVRDAAAGSQTGGCGNLREQNATIDGATNTSGLPATPTIADVDAVVAQLAALQRKLGSWTPETRRQVIGLLLETLEDRAVLHLVDAVPGGYRRPVTHASALPAEPSVADVARQALADALVERHAAVGAA